MLDNKYREDRDEERGDVQRDGLCRPQRGHAHQYCKAALCRLFFFKKITKQMLLQRLPTVRTCTQASQGRCLPTENKY